MPPRLGTKIIPIGAILAICWASCTAALGFSPDTLAGLGAKGHALVSVPELGCAQVIFYRRDEKIFEGGSDARRRDGGGAAY